MSGISIGLETMRMFVTEETDGYENRIIQAKLLREHWLSVYSTLEEGGSLHTEKSSFIYFTENAILILWRKLDMANVQDRAYALRWVKENTFDNIPPENLDVIVGYLDSSQEILFQPYSSRLLAKYEEAQP